MLGNIIAIAILVAAAAIAARMIWLRIKGKAPVCSCGCEHCDIKSGKLEHCDAAMQLDSSRIALDNRDALSIENDRKEARL